MHLNILYEDVTPGTGGPVSKPSFVPYSMQTKVGQTPKLYRGEMSPELINFIKRAKDYNLEKKIKNFDSTEIRLQKELEHERILKHYWNRLSDQDKKGAENHFADDQEVDLRKLDANKARHEKRLQRDIEKELRKRLGI